MPFLDNADIGLRLKKIRETKKVSVRRFAMDAKVDQSQYSKIEKGELPITENILKKLVSVYHLDKKQILFGTNVPRETETYGEARLVTEGSEVEDTEHLEKSIWGLVEDRKRAISVIERLTTVLEDREKRIKEGIKVDNPGTDGTISYKKKAGQK